MSRILLFVVFIAAAMVGSAQAETRFDGTITFTKANNCTFLQVGWRFSSTYMIAGLGGNANVSAITTVFENGSHGYQLDGGRFGPAFKVVRATGYSNTRDEFRARVKVVFSRPATNRITPTTDFVWIRGAIESPFGDTGIAGKPCVGEFRAAYLRRR